MHLGPRLPERIAEGRLLTYGDRRRHLLLECPYRTRPVRLEETIFELKVAGVTPVLAHPERIRYFQEDLSRYEEMVRLGSLGQMTSSSLLGVFGKPIQALSEKLVRRGLVHVLGSDAHDTEYRPPPAFGGPALGGAGRRGGGPSCRRGLSAGLAGRGGDRSAAPRAGTGEARPDGPSLRPPIGPGVTLAAPRRGRRPRVQV
ncbi:MAG: CpsB/CapC family capsule biosynthesis tyrosine phosphatase [Acidobacteriota bacterium]|nr:CpsB/CapC family capsule biosynthesis tyrosine phosphatase [Acidobacteriota bacterium]